MVAITVNGEIKTFSSVPKKWSDENGVYLNLNSESAYELGFRDVVRPEYDSRIQKLGDLYLEGNEYTCDVEDIDFPLTLSEMKQQKILEVKSKVAAKLSVTDWYNYRKMDEGIEMPSEILKERIELRSKGNEIEKEINSLSTKKSVVLLDINI